MKLKTLLSIGNKTLLVCLSLFVFFLPFSGALIAQENTTCPLATIEDTNFSFSLDSSSIQITTKDSKLLVQVEGFESSKGFSCPLLPFYTHHLYKHIDSIWLNDVSWKPVLLHDSLIPYSKIKNYSNISPTGDFPSNVTLLPPGNPIDFVNYNTLQDPMSLIHVYPFQFKNGYLFYADSIHFSIQLKNHISPSISESTTKKELIICPDDWHEEATLIQQLHQDKGIISTIVTLSTIMEVSNTINHYRTIGEVHGLEEIPKKYWMSLETWDLDVAKKIQSFLLDYNEETPSDFITLLGDGSIIPPSFYSYEETGYSQARDFYNSIVPTDFFYMSPNGGGHDLFITSTLGRIPVRTKRELQEYVEKLYCYYLSQEWNWFSNISLVGGDLFNDSYVGEMLCQSIINNNLNSYNVHTYFTSENKCNEASIKDLFNTQRSGFVNLCAHGSGAEVRLEPGFFTSVDIMELPPSDELPIVFSYSCMNGSYDTTLSNITYEFDPVFGFPTSFGESLLLSKGGSIAYVGGSRVNYSGFDIQYHEDGLCEYSHPVHMDAMCTYFFGSLDDSQYLGDMTKECLTTYIQKQYANDRTLHSFIGFTLLGDPLIPILKSPTENQKRQETSSISISKKVVPNNTPSYSPPFLDNSQPINLSFSGVSEVWISNYLQPGVILFHWKSPSPNKSFSFSSLPNTTLCFRFRDTSKKECRYVLKTSSPFDASISHPYSLIQEVYPDEVYPYVFSLSNTGFSPIQEVVSTITMTNEKGLLLVSDETSYESLPIGFSQEISTTLNIPTLQGIYKILHTISYSTQSVQRKKTIQYELHCSNQPIIRLGIPCNKWYLKKLKQRIPLKEINLYYKKMNKRCEYVFIPAHNYNHYTTNALLLFDHYWDHLEYRNQEDLLQSYSAKGGVTIGASANTIHDRNQKLIVSFFGIPDIRYSHTNYSRHLESLHNKKLPHPVFNHSFYFIHSRANWEPLKDNFWFETNKIESNATRILLSEDSRISLWQSNLNRYFLSCSFLTLDPEAKTDSTRLLLDDILSTTKDKMIPLTTTIDE